MSELRDLVELGDVDELVRHVDRLCAREAWEELVELRRLSRAALERGRQLWPVAARVEYRLALEAPGPWAARMVEDGSGRFSLGPLPEVAASTHRWDDLAPHLSPGAPPAAMAAHERVVRGEDLRHDGRVDPAALEVPLALQRWEPAYPAAAYTADEATFPLAPVEGFGALQETTPGRPAADPETVRALVELGATWASESNGASAAAAVHGDALAALGALGVPRARLAPLAPAGALARMAWAAASGGAHGRRRGMAAGRFSAWWAASALVGLLEDYPPDPDDLGEAVAELRWWAWDAGGPEVGWACRLAVEDPGEGLAWALDASDAASGP